MSDHMDNRVINKPVIPTFFHSLLPATLGILAMSSASIVDGIFIGNYVGTHALAAVNLLMPLFSLIAGLAMMVAIGGAVRAGKFLGEHNTQAASGMFSKTLIAIAGYGVSLVLVMHYFKTTIFYSFGADALLLPLMTQYLDVLLPVLPLQLVTITLYFYCRTDGLPSLAAFAFIVASLLNIGLDYLFIARWEWGIAGAARATALSQVTSFLILLVYFRWPSRRLRFSIKQTDWQEIPRAAFNGLSAFISSISASVIVFILNWLLMLRLGIDGVAAMTVVNYLLMIGMMLFFAIEDTGNVLISQNYGGQQPKRVQQLLWLSITMVLITSLITILLLLTLPDTLTQLFLDPEATEAGYLAETFIHILWPTFLVCGLNVILAGYFTAMHLPVPSALIALSRSLILPVLLLLGLYAWLPGEQFLWALPIAEGLTFLLAAYLFWHRTPHKIMDSIAP